MNFIPLDTALRLADLALQDALRRGIAKASIVVTDGGGNIRAALRADAAGTFGVDTALGKARTALGFNASSLALAKTFETTPAAAAALSAATGGRFLPIGGGVVVADADGFVVGAAAMSGGLPEIDDEIVTRAIVDCGLHVK
jgi:uncharacterized protein GlcG (DUF336 family)